MNKKYMAALVVPFISCAASSAVGLVLGQIGNSIYRLFGEAGTCLALPGIVGVFIITGLVSFQVSQLLRRKLIK